MGVSNQAPIGVIIRADGVVETANGVKLTAVEVKKLGEAMSSASNDAKAFSDGQGKASAAVDKTAAAMRGGSNAAQQLNKDQQQLSAGTIAMASTITQFGVEAVMRFTNSLVQSGQQSIKNSAEIARLADKYQVAAETLSTIKYAADLSDTSMEAVASGMDRLGKNAVQASRGLGDARMGFSVLGIDVKDTTGSLKTQDALLLEVAEKLSRVEDNTTRAALAQMIFGRAGADLLPFLNNGAEGLRRLQEEGKKWAEISGMNAVEAKRLKDQQVELDYATQALGKNLAAMLVPQLNAVMRAFLDGKREGDGFLGTLRAIGAAVGQAWTGGDRKIAQAKLVSGADDVLKSQNEIDRLEGMYGRNSNMSLLRDQRRKLALAQQQVREAQAFLKIDEEGLGGTAAKKPTDGGKTAGDLALAQLTDKYRNKQQLLEEELKRAKDAYESSSKTQKQTEAYENAVAKIKEQYKDRSGRSAVRAAADPADNVLLRMNRENAKLQDDLDSVLRGGSRPASTARTQLEADIEGGKYAKTGPAEIQKLREAADAQDNLKDSIQASAEAWKYYEQNEKAVAAAQSKSIEQSQQWRIALQEQAEQSRINAIQDPAARAEAMLAKEKAVWQKRIEMADEASGLKRLIEEDYAAWLIAKQDEITEQLKPAWQRMLEGWQDVTRMMRDSYNSLQNSVIQAGEQIAVQFGRTGKLSGQSLLQAFQDELSRSAYRKFFAPALSGGVDFFWKALQGGGGGPSENASFASAAGAGDSSIFAPELHTGGVAGAEGRGRMLPASSWMGARKYHTGGIAADEVPAVLKRGEGVFTKGQMAALGAGMSGGSGIGSIGVEIHNQGTPQQVTSATPRFDGERMVIDIVTRDVANNGPIGQAVQARYGLRMAS